MQSFLQFLNAALYFRLTTPLILKLSAPTHPPRSLTFTSTARSITASYFPPVTTTGTYQFVLTYYKIADGSATAQTLPATSMLSVTISALTPHSLYHLEVSNSVLPASISCTSICRLEVEPLLVTC